MFSIQREKVLIVCVLIVGANICDLLTTYLYTPDLRYEGNILVRNLGLGWISLIAMKGLAALAGVFLYLYYVNHRRELYPAGNAGMLYFINYFMHGREVRWPRSLYELPKLKNVLAWGGFLYSVAGAWYYYMLSVDTLCAKYGYHFSFPYYIEALLAVCLSLFWMIIVCYKDYKKVRQVQ